MLEDYKVIMVRVLDHLLFDGGYQKRITCPYTPQNGWWKQEQACGRNCLFVIGLSFEYWKHAFKCVGSSSY